jgi:HlyD family secretion protein
MQEGAKPKRARRRLIWVVAAVIVVLLCLTPIIITRRMGNNQETDQVGETVIAFTGDLSSSITAAGKVTAPRRVSLTAGSPARVESLTVRPGDLVQTGQVLMQLDNTTLGFDVALAQQNLALREANLRGLLEEPGEAQIVAAEAAVASAQAALDDLLDGPGPEEVRAKEADLRAAGASVSSAEGQLSQVQHAIKPADIATAEAAVVAAKANLKAVEIQYSRNPAAENVRANTALVQAREQLASAQARLEDLLGGPDQDRVGSAQAGLAAALAQQDAVQAQLDRLKAAPSVSQVAGLEAQLAQAQANLVNLTAGPTSEAVAVAQAELDQARIALEGAQAAFDEASITAPFDGLVTAVNFSVGESASGQVIEIVDSGFLEVVLEVDEIDVGGLAFGQPATLTLEAWPELIFESHITAIAPSARTIPGSSLVIYEVRLTLEGQGIPLLLGMTANATLVTVDQEGVLLVPNQTIVADRANGTFSVGRVVGDDVETVMVTIGIRDGQHTHITGGLEAGDELLAGESLTNIESEQGGFFFGGHPGD